MSTRGLLAGVAAAVIVSVTVTTLALRSSSPAVTLGLAPAPGTAAAPTPSVQAAEVTVDAVPVVVRSPVLPTGSLQSTTPGSAYQVASSVSYASPYAALEFGAIPYGRRNAALSAQQASKGSAAAFLKEIADARASSGQVFARAVPAFLFGRSVEGQVTQTVGLAGGVQTTRLHAEWVTEAGDRVWILRITADDLSDATRDQLIATLPQLTVASPSVTRPTTVTDTAPAGAPFRAADSSFSLDLPPWWGAHDCDSARNGAHEVLATWNGLEACGPNVDLPSGSFSARGAPAWSYEYEWECVELSKRYLWQRYGVPDQPADGFATVDAEARAAPSLVVFHPDGVHVPQAGDVVSFGTTSPGHTAVVMKSTVDASGNGSYTTLNENVGRQAVIAFDIRNWVPTTTNGGRGTGIPPVNDWLHDPANRPGLLGPGGLGKPGTDLAPSTPTVITSSFVRIPDGTEYRIVGSAPLKVGSCAGLPAACASPQSVPDLHGLGAVPVDGTTLAAGDSLYRVAGGAPLRLGSCAALGGCGAGTVVDPAVITSLDHLRAVPLDGTLLRVDAGGGRFRVAGGAPLPYTECPVAGGCAGEVAITAGTISLLDHLRAAPVDGTVLRGWPSGDFWVIRGGERVPSGSSPAAVTVADAAIAAIAARGNPTGRAPTAGSPTTAASPPAPAP